jgi:hypothetical protein
VIQPERKDLNTAAEKATIVPIMATLPDNSNLSAALAAMKELYLAEAKRQV